MTDTQEPYSIPYKKPEPAQQQSQPVQQPAQDPNIQALEKYVKEKHQINMTAHAQYQQFPIPGNLATMLKAAIDYHQAAITLSKAMLANIEKEAQGGAS